MLQDVLAREAPVAPPEVAHLVKGLEVESSRYGIPLCELPNAGFLRAIADRLKELAMIAWPVLPEVLEDICERRFWHLHLQKVVAHRDHRIIGPGFTPERQWLLTDTLVDDSVGEH